MNYLQEIRSTSLEVVHKSKDVFINDEEIQRLIGNDEVFPIDIQKSLEKIQWDSEGWHYCSDAEARGPLTAQYIFVLDALNFCFWPCAGFEYVDLAVNLKTVFEKDFQQFSAESLSQMSEVCPFTSLLCFVYSKCHIIRNAFEAGLLVGISLSSLRE